MSLHVAKTVSFRQYHFAVFDQRQRRARNVLGRHEAEHESINGIGVRR